MTNTFKKSPGGNYSGKKRRKRVMKEFMMSEISAVDRPAQQSAVMSIMKRDDAPAMEKVMLLSSEQDGHQHSIDIDMETIKRGGGNTSYEASGEVLEGTTHVDHHSHPFIINSDGTISIGSNTGHTHEIESNGLIERLTLQAAFSSGTEKEDDDIEVEVNVYKATDYALTPDLMDNTTWQHPLTKRPNGPVDRTLVGSVVHLLKRNKIPQKHVEAVTRKVRKAWVTCNPNQKRSRMPTVLKRTFID